MTDYRLCPHASHAPHGCGLVAAQVVRDAEGNVIGVYRCTFCGEQRRERKPEETKKEQKE